MEMTSVDSSQPNSNNYSGPMQTIDEFSNPSSIDESMELAGELARADGRAFIGRNDVDKALASTRRGKAKPAIMRGDFWTLTNARAKVAGSGNILRITEELKTEYEIFEKESDFNAYVIEKKTGQALKGMIDYFNSAESFLNYLKKWADDHNAINLIREALGLPPVALNIGPDEYGMLYDMGILDEWADTQSGTTKSKVLNYKMEREKIYARKQEIDGYIRRFLDQANIIGDEPAPTLSAEKGSAINPEYPTYLMRRNQLLEGMEKEKTRFKLEAQPAQVTLYEQLKKIIQGGNKAQARIDFAKMIVLK